MRNYIDPATREVFSYEDDAPEYFVRLGLVPIDDDELSTIRAEQESSAAPDPEQLAGLARSRRDQLLGSAGLRIAPLQDAMDLGRATQAEQSLLKRWKAYRIDVNDVTSQPGFPTNIKWPDEPAQ